MPKTDLDEDHAALPDWAAVRRYFAKFERIIGHAKDVAGTVPRRGKLAGAELAIIEDYLGRLAQTFLALSYKHMFAGRDPTARVDQMEIDRRESGFPVYGELLQMANDALQAEKRLRGMPDVEELKASMVRHILSEQETPKKLHYTMSQRLYYEWLLAGKLFLPQNDPEAVYLSDMRDRARRRYLIHWATYDSQLNIPSIYLAIVEDSGRKPLLKDERRWPALQAHLMAQSVGSLKMVTIGQGLDVDFDDLHPKFVRRMHIGPMYSHTFTKQNGPLREVLAEASGSVGLDWALTWTTETLISGAVREEKSGWFGTVEREIFKLDKEVLEEEGPGATKVEHSLILPERAYQVLRHRDPRGLRDVKRYVVGENGKVLSGI